MVAAAKPAFAKQVEAGMDTVRRLGNLYTGSLFGALASLICNVEGESLVGKRIGFYAYGSGAAASFYAAKVVKSTAFMAKAVDLENRLTSMKIVPSQTFVDAINVRLALSLPLPSTLCAIQKLTSRPPPAFKQLRESTHNAVSYKPVGALDNLWPGAYYLSELDSMWRRKYVQAPAAEDSA
jgi:hydroxymethylglutaryl-CoA synthase